MVLTDLNELKLFATHPHPCSYLKGEAATTIFVDPNAEMDGPTYDQLSQYGFRRSGAHIYRPRCESCQACVPIRIPVDAFIPTRSQKRCVKKNADLKLNEINSIDTEEHYALYEKYIEGRHSDGDMYPPTRAQYKDFLSAEWGITRFLEFRNAEGTLLCVAVADDLCDASSAIYTFFDPEENKRALGVFAILSQIQRAQDKKLASLYLGYWIKGCQKMSYKIDYRPFQLLVNGNWITLT